MPPVLVDTNMSTGSTSPSVEDLVAFGELKKSNDKRAIEIYSNFEKSKDETQFHKALLSYLKSKSDGKGASSRNGGQSKDKVTNQREGKSNVNSNSNSNSNSKTASFANSKTNRNEKRAAKRSTGATGSTFDDKPNTPVSKSSTVDGIAEMKEGDKPAEKAASKGPMSWADRVTAPAPAPVKVAELVDATDAVDNPENTADLTHQPSQSTSDKKEKKKSLANKDSTASKTDEEKKIGEDLKVKADKRKAAKSSTIVTEKEKPVAPPALSWAKRLTLSPQPAATEDVVETVVEDTEAKEGSKREKKKNKNKKDKETLDGKDSVTVVTADSEASPETGIYKNEVNDVKSNKNNKKEKKEKKKKKNEDKVETDVEDVGTRAPPGIPPGIPPGLPTSSISLENDADKVSADARLEKRREKDRARRKSKSIKATANDDKTESVPETTTILDLKEDVEEPLEDVAAKTPATTTDIFFGDPNFSFDLTGLDDKEEASTSTVPTAPPGVVAPAESNNSKTAVPVVPVKTEDTLVPPGVSLPTQPVAPALNTAYTNTTASTGNTYKSAPSANDSFASSTRGPPAVKKDQWSNPYPVKSNAALSNLHPATFSESQFYQPTHSQINQSMTVDPMNNQSHSNGGYNNSSMDTNNLFGNINGNTMSHYTDFSQTPNNTLNSIDFNNNNHHNGIFNHHLMSEDLPAKKSNNSHMSTQAQQFQQLNNINNNMVSNNTGLVGNMNMNNTNNSNANGGLWSQAMHPNQHPNMGMMGPTYDMNMMNVMGQPTGNQQQPMSTSTSNPHMGTMGQMPGVMPGFDINSQYMALFQQYQMAQLQQYYMNMNMANFQQQPGQVNMTPPAPPMAPTNMMNTAEVTPSTTSDSISSASATTATTTQPQFSTTANMDVPALTATNNTLLSTNAVESTEISLSNLVESAASTTTPKDVKDSEGTKGAKDVKDVKDEEVKTSSKKRKGKGKNEGNKDESASVTAGATTSTETADKAEKASKSTIKTEQKDASKSKTKTKVVSKKDTNTKLEGKATMKEASTTSVNEGQKAEGTSKAKAKKTGGSSNKGKDLLSMLRSDPGESKPSKNPFA